MKFILGISLLVSMNLFAQRNFGNTIAVTAEGSAYGTCDKSNEYSCISSIKRNAQSSALRMADANCRELGGYLQTQSICSPICSPSSLPDQGNHWVSCSISLCSVTCVLN